MQNKQREAWRRVTAPVPNAFEAETRSQQRSIGNLARIAFQDYLQRRGAQSQSGKQNIKQAGATP